jgi:glutathione peroxidase
MGKGVYDFSVTDHQGQERSLKDYAGSVLLIVNTASKCGLTPQYEGLQALYTQYGDKGLQVLAFPCNQFGEQEPGTNAEIQAFCQTNYGVTFPVFSKIDVNGETAHPLYQYLTGLAEPGPIQWNFTKFLFDRDGQFVARFEPRVPPAELVPAIEDVL